MQKTAPRLRLRLRVPLCAAALFSAGARAFAVRTTARRGLPLAFRGGSSPPGAGPAPLSATAATDVPTSPIAGMRPGTSGLRKKVEVWSDTPHYVENFVQSLLDVASSEGPVGSLLVAGDGRYYNREAMGRLFCVLAGNGVGRVLVPRGGLMSTPAVSACVRRLGGGEACGAIVLTASHNPGGPGQDFGIKYNGGLGQPADEKFTEAAYARSLEISSYRTVAGGADGVDLDAPVGTEFSIGAACTVVIVDPFAVYVECLKECFDFDALRSFWGGSGGPTLLFDGMHGAGGPFAQRVLVEELGMDPATLMRCDPRTDFGGCHPDPNLTYAHELVRKMGLRPDGSAAPPPAPDGPALPTLGAANDGDGDRNMIAGAGFFVTPSDSMALILDNWEAIPHFADQGGPKGAARSMPSSAALDAVATAKNIPLFITPTGWKFFGNLMSSKELFGGTDYGPFLCGEESFGTGSDHIREKDGLWAVLAWMSIVARANSHNPSPPVSVEDIVRAHWRKYGRHFYCRYDYEEVDADAADALVARARSLFVDGDAAAAAPPGHPSGIDLVSASEFSYTDPVDGSVTTGQGLVLQFACGEEKEAARAVFRLSGTGSAGATVRMYLEKFGADTARHGEAAPDVLQGLAERACGLVQMAEMTGRDRPTVIT